ncbi:hypothetical protein V8E51_015043 [Hyaloscypha variabilis]|uniref:EamA domain-containing protein n=1 Tax=Hyaloscypha variabilis (strain UAMH 11265 / GT02V1 / F) TaxID=1149755 RepID=A0A2J6RC51_HYAVF|nr:hypothetical protein L207DRAFT_465708 [Hyaloscypha variabilis F]
MLRQRAPKDKKSSVTKTSQATQPPRTGPGHAAAMDTVDDPQQPLLGARDDAALSQRHLSSPSQDRSSEDPQQERFEDGQAKEMENLSKKSQWIVLALASGACAAFNGVFAKLTTTELTTSFATWVANLIGLSNIEGGVEVVVRAIFFGLNLIFNGIMWTLFTKALARGTSTTQVSILNTSSNFMITAVLGWMIFSESLPPLWFVGAALLVAGNVIIGRRDEGEEKGKGDEQARAENGNVNNEEAEGLLIGEELDDLDESELERKKREEEDVLQLDLEEENHGRSGGTLI